MNASREPASSRCLILNTSSLVKKIGDLDERRPIDRFARALGGNELIGPRQVCGSEMEGVHGRKTALCSLHLSNTLDAIHISDPLGCAEVRIVESFLKSSFVVDRFRNELKLNKGTS